MQRIKLKSTLTKLAISIGITLAATFCIIPTINPKEVYAEDGNGKDEGHSGNLNNHKNGGYPSYSKTGWLIYLYDYKSGSTPFGAKLIKTGNLSGSMQVQSVFGVGPSSTVGAGSLPPPWNENRSPNGTKVKNGLLTKNGPYYWQKLVKGVWSQAVLQKVQEEPSKYYLVLEVVDCHAVKPGSGGGSNVTTATVHNWAHIDLAAGIPETGNSATGWCDNAVAPDSAFLDKDWEGLPDPPTQHAGGLGYGRIPSSLVGSNSLGYGMIAVRLQDDLIHTYWEPNDSPGDPEPAPPNKIGKYNIVKAYHTVTMKAGKIISDEHDLTTTTANCIPNISVDDEPKEYRLEYWTSDSDYNPGIEKPLGFIFFALNYDCMKLRAI